jgi:hypothetical protein
MLSAATRQLLGIFDKVDRKVRTDNIYMGCIPAILTTAPVPNNLPHNWALHDYDHSIEAHWKTMDSDQKALLFNQHENSIKANKADHQTSRRILVEDFEKFGYKRPASVLRPPAAVQLVQAVPTTRSPPVQKVVTKRSSPPKASLAAVKPLPAMAVTTPTGKRQTRVIYEVMDVRLNKKNKNPMISVRYNASKDTDWIYSSQVLDPESEAALRQVLLKLK